MDPVHIFMDPVHGPGPWRGSMDQGSMFCTFPNRNDRLGANFGGNYGIFGIFVVNRQEVLF